MIAIDSLIKRHQNVSRETLEKLITYHDLLVKWNKAINLVAPGDDFWKRHFEDSLQLLKYIPESDAKPVIVDVGSGAGFPGLVLAIAGAGEVTLIESDKRKCEFLKNVSRETNCPVTVLNQRVEETEIPNVKFITSRACAPLSELLYLTQHLWQKDSVGLFHKGKRYQDEITEAKTKQMFHVKHFPSETDPDGVILQVEELCQTPDLTPSPSSTKKVE